MPTELLVPALGESVVEATIARWLKAEGDAVKAGEAVVELETDKVDLEVPADKDGVLTAIKRPEGEDVQIGDVLAILEAGEGKADASAQKEDTEDDTPTAEEDTSEDTPATEGNADAQAISEDTSAASANATPVAKRMAAENAIKLTAITGSGTDGRITKQDVEKHLQSQASQAAVEKTTSSQSDSVQPQAAQATSAPDVDPRGEERIKMSRRRRTIAERLVQAQQTAAMLTTFNEIDMSAVMDLRKRRQEGFVARHDIKLGFMSFFVKASIGALKTCPQVNAEIQGTDIVLKHYYDIGMAVGADEGLVVPVLRNADRMSFAEIEQAIKNLAGKARDGSLAIDDLRGGTFTVTNGGIFGSMLSTPILNPPQVGILGLHKIEERPVVVVGNDGTKEIAIRPMMYVALSYDHRMVDGREAVQFLVKVKELIEDPEVLLLEG